MKEDSRPLELIIQDLLAGRENIVILEAGCGSMSHFNYDKNAYLVGIDISQEQLDKNTYLNHKILGDLQDENTLPSSSYDLIICWDVIEHLTDPTAALNNFVRALKEGGLILLAGPNIMTLRGLIVKFSPYWVHVAYYRYLLGYRDAGKPGTHPFKSYHRFAMAPHSITKYAERKKLIVELARYSKFKSQEDRHVWFKLIWNSLDKLVHIISFGKIATDDKMGFQIILKKPSTSLSQK